MLPKSSLAYNKQPLYSMTTITPKKILSNIADHQCSAYIVKAVQMPDKKVKCNFKWQHITVKDVISLNILLHRNKDIEPLRFYVKQGNYICSLSSFIKLYPSYLNKDFKVPFTTIFTACIKG